MGGLEAYLLNDVLSIATLALILGLLVHGLLKRSRPELGWGSLGNVWTQPFGKTDLLVVGMLLVYAYWTIHQAAGPAASSPEEGTSLSIDEAWFGTVFFLFVLSSLFFFLGFVRNMNLSEVFGLTRLRPLRIVALAALAMLVALPLVLLAQKGVSLLVFEDRLEDLKPQKAVQALANTDDLRLKVLMIFSACLVAPVAEEFFFRGYIYAVVKRFSDRSFSTIFTSTVFAVIHMNALSLAPLWVLALCFTIAYEVTGCLWVPIAMHAIFNSVSVAVIMIFPDAM